MPLVLSETSGPIGLEPVTTLQRICGFYKATVMSLGQPNQYLFRRVFILKKTFLVSCTVEFKINNALEGSC